MTFIGVSLAALGLFWLAGTAGLARANRDYLLAAAAALAGGLLLERGPAELFALESDRLSIVHVLLFMLLAGFWMIIGRAEPPAGLLARASAAVARYAGSYAPAAAGPCAPAAIARILAALIGVMAIAALMLLCFPELRQGPLGRVDPLYARIRLHNIVEIQPLVALEWLSSGRVGEALQRLIKVIGIALFALPCLALLLARSTGAAWRFWTTVALALLAFLPLTFYQVRWATYAEAFLVWPYAAGIAWLLTRFTRAEQPAGVLLRPLLILAALFWPLLLGAALPEQKIESAGPRLSARSPGRGAQSHAGAANSPRLRRLRRRAPVSDADTACCRSQTIGRSRASPRPGASSPRPARRPPGRS